MTALDLSDVLDIEVECHLNPWTEGIFKDCIRVGYYCPVLMVDGEMCAYAVMSIVAGEGHIFNVCVKQNYQRQGYGKQVVLHLLEFAKEKKATNIFLEVRPSNISAINLYEQLGFNEIGLRKDYYPSENGREDALIMAIDILED